jgi:predicted Rossmann fold nucleotide-binding protein DprA/Smf involved in DNA uptake
MSAVISLDVRPRSRKCSTLIEQNRALVTANAKLTEELAHFKIQATNDSKYIGMLADGIVKRDNAAHAASLAGPNLARMLVRLVEKVERANCVRSGGRLIAEDWSELFQLTKEARGVLANSEGTK